jgi:endonuclease YncB( thermonuclease family)
MTRAVLVALVLLVSGLAPPARAEITGRATVIDGDTIAIGGQRIRLFGIDAPENGQTCVAETQWRCGEASAFALATLIGVHRVHCTERYRDQYQRIVAVCRLSGPKGPDLNAFMVREGWALAYRFYSTDYVEDEQEARDRRVGVWRGRLLAPWDWRARQQAIERAATMGGSSNQTGAGNQTPAKSGDCNIKGNVSVNTGERIYHVPGGKYYNPTIISASKGERWFCSEAEAQAAGWRRSKQ